MIKITIVGQTLDHWIEFNQWFSSHSNLDVLYTTATFIQLSQIVIRSYTMQIGKKLVL